MEGGAWWAIVHGVAKGRARLSDFYVFYVKIIIFYIEVVPDLLQPHGL